MPQTQNKGGYITLREFNWYLKQAKNRDAAWII
jgi:hypothetical protein